MFFRNKNMLDSFINFKFTMYLLKIWVLGNKVRAHYGKLGFVMNTQIANS